ncbi:hypothetical protein GCM10027019_08950 [Melaminivora jejuensis]
MEVRHQEVRGNRAWGNSDHGIMLLLASPAVQALRLYVHGSDARGPMRAGNLPAFATRAAAQAFARRRGGRVLAYGQVDGAVIAALAGSGGHGAH